MWNGVNATLDAVKALDAHFIRLESRSPGLLPDFRRAARLIVASDYSGAHEASDYDVFACIITSEAAFARWDAARKQVRHVFRLGDRRISYTKLNDAQKVRALGAFLNTVGAIDGLLCCLAINKKLPSLFNASGTEWVHDPRLDEWRVWKPAVFERMLRITSLVACVTAGLATGEQSVIWATDEDSIVSNQAQADKLAKAFGNMAGTYSSGRIKAIRLLTTASDTDRETEDLAAVPDLAAGALTDLFTALHARGARLSNPLTLLIPDGVSGKAHQILHWLRVFGQPLRRVTFVVEQGRIAGDIDITQVNLS